MGMSDTSGGFWLEASEKWGNLTCRLITFLLILQGSQARTYEGEVSL